MQIKPERTLRIENIVASAKVADSMDPADLALKIPDAEYDRKRFPGAVVRLSDPRLAFLLFGSGKVVITGAKSLADLKKGTIRLRDLLRSQGIQTPDEIPFTVQNIVTSADLGTPINLNKIVLGLNLERVEYEPEQFPGLVYRIDEPKVVVLIFGSGKLIITGGRVPEDAERTVTKILADLHKIAVL